MWCNMEPTRLNHSKKIFFPFYQVLHVPFFDVSKYFEFREMFGEQQYIKPAKLRLL